MAKEKYEENKENPGHENAAVKPDPETLNTTDPQEHMEGPLSSLMHSTGESIEGDDDDDNDSTKQ